MPDSRHAEYIRQLRADWDIVPIEELGTIVSGGTPSRNVPAYWGDYLSWVTPGEITQLGQKIVWSTREKISEAGLRNSNAQKLPVGSLLVTSRATVGYVALAGIEVCTNQGFKSIIPSESCHPDFYYHMLNYISAEFSRLASGSTFLEISRRDFGAIRVPFPPLSEQRRIAEILDTVDAAIQHTEALIAKLKQIKAGLLHDLLTRGLDEHGQLRDPVTHPEQFKDSPLGRIPRGWTICSLGELVDSAVDGPFGSNLKTEHYVSQPGVRVVRLQNIGNGYFDESDKAYMSGAHARMLQRHEVVAGDLLIASLGDDNHPIARACLYPISTQPGIVKADCFRFRLQRSSAIHAYVMHVLNCPSTRGDINLLGQGVTRDRVNLTIVQKVRLRLPPTPEQERIVVVLDAHDARIRAEEAYRDKLKQLKKGLMDDLLTGRVRVKSTTNHTQEADDDQASLSSVPKMQTED